MVILFFNGMIIRSYGVANKWIYNLFFLKKKEEDKSVTNK